MNNTNEFGLNPKMYDEIVKQLDKIKSESGIEFDDNDYQKELDRINKKEIAIISATGYGKVTSEDEDNNGVPDVLELSKLEHEREKTAKDLHSFFRINNCKNISAETFVTR